MHKHLSQKQEKSLLDDVETCRKLEFNNKRNLEQDQTELIDAAAKAFKYEDHKHAYWNPEEFSLLYGTPFWEQASSHQRLILNHLYWVAYYSQIVSAEIATIYLNQVSAAGLYTFEDFRLVCDALDLETKQERAHINAFKTVSEDPNGSFSANDYLHIPCALSTGKPWYFPIPTGLRNFGEKLICTHFAPFPQKMLF